MKDIDDDDETPSLSSSALDALREFYIDRDARQQQFEDLKAVAEEGASSGNPLSMEAFAEDWNESQFWYSDETATLLAEELLRGADAETSIAVVSAPSVFVQLKNLVAASGKSAEERPRLFLLEFDKRFEVFPEFVFYDFQKPLKLPREWVSFSIDKVNGQANADGETASMKGTIDHIICDPPFLSEDCQTKAAMTVRWLSKSRGTSRLPEESQPRLIVCTGERMESLITKLYRSQGISTTTFEPVHSKGLSNEFYCYANFECERWKWTQRN